MTIDAEFKISLLGHFEVDKVGQEPIQFVADSARALLAYLAANPEIQHSRENLATLFWPDNNRSSSFNNLRQALKRLKDAVGDEETDTPLVISEKKVIQLNPEANIWVDVYDFEEAMQKAQSTRIEDSVTYLEEALNLYRGEFLNDFHIKSYPFEEWLSANQTKYKEQVLLALSKMSAFYFQRSEFDAVIQYSRRMLEMEPWYEEAHRQLMIAMAMNNQRNRALAEYRRYYQDLKHYLDIEPEIETIDIYHRIRSGEIGRSRSTARTPRINFPSPTTSFIGRHEELRHIQQEIADPDRRLITLVGAGGAGKTRLSLALADLVGNDFSNGVVFIPVEDLTQKGKSQEEIVKDDHYISTRIADALNLKLFNDISLKDQIFEYLKTINMLMVFDNYEDVIETAPFLIEILQNSPDVTILVTSRERLNLNAEVIFRVDGFNVPEGVNTPRLESFHSIQLFIERANRFPLDYDLNQEMDAIIQICRLVDGMPLGIELAANLIEQMPPWKILKSIQQDIDVLSSTLQDIPKRHRSIRAIFESSWRFLTKQEQMMYSRLSVFSSGFQLDTGVKVTKGDEETIKNLRDKSLLMEVGGDRMAMHKVLHQLAAEKLKRAKTTRDLHAKYYLNLLADREIDFGGENTRQVIERLYPDLANIRQAWLWASANHMFSQLDKSLNGLYALYSLRGMYHEGQILFEDTIQQINAKKRKNDPPPQLYSRLLVNTGWFLMRQGELDQALEVLRSAITLAEKKGFQQALAEAHLVIGKTEMRLGRWDQAIKSVDTSIKLARKNKFRQIEVMALYSCGAVYAEQVQYAKAQEAYKEALDSMQDLEDLLVQVDLLNGMGSTAYQMGQYDQALKYFDEALDVNQKAGNLRMDGILWNNLADVMVRLGDFQTALVYYAKSQQNSLLISDRMGQANALQALAHVSLQLGNTRAALAHSEQGIKLSETYELGQVNGFIFHRMGDVQTALENYSQAADYYKKAFEQNKFFGRTQFTMDNLEGMARTAMLTGDKDKALEYTQDILAYLKAHSLIGTNDPMRIYLTCYQVLNSNQDERACPLIQDAHGLLMEQYDNIQAHDLKLSFLGKVAVHQEIVQAVQTCK